MGSGAEKKAGSGEVHYVTGTAPALLLVLRAPDSQERVWYVSIERFVLDSSDRSLKFIRVVNHSAMNNIKIIDAHNLI